MSSTVPPTSFGIFYPSGWTVVAFATEDAAQRVRRDLLTGGYSEDDCRMLRPEQVIPAAKGQLNDAGFLAQLGMADDMVARHLAAAKRGGTFLVIYAPSDPEAERVMTVVRRVPFDFAHRYRRLAIEELK